MKVCSINKELILKCHKKESIRPKKPDIKDLENASKKMFKILNISLGNTIDINHINKYDLGKYILKTTKKEQKDMNIGKIVYITNEVTNQIKIFGKRFVEINKNKAKIIRNNKKYNLKEEIIDKKENTIFKIKLKFLENMFNIESMFEECIKLLFISLFPKYNTKYLKNLQCLFCNCSSLKYIDALNDWNINNVTNISKLYYGCSSLEILPDISKWETNKITNMNKLFYFCSSLKSLPDISNWNTNNVTNLSSLFNGCSSLTSLPDLSKWNTNNVTNLSFLFGGCSSLTSLPDISEWKTNNVINLSMFIINFIT